MRRQKTTHRQKRAIRAWINGGFKSKADALREAGYSKTMIRNPDRVFGSPAVMAELERLGFNPDGTKIDYPAEHIQVKEEVEEFDISKISKEQILILKEKLEETGYTAQPKEEKVNFPYVPQGPEFNVFGEEMYKKEEYSGSGNFSL